LSKELDALADSLEDMKSAIYFIESTKNDLRESAEKLRKALCGFGAFSADALKRLSDSEAALEFALTRMKELKEQTEKKWVLESEKKSKSMPTFSRGQFVVDQEFGDRAEFLIREGDEVRPVVDLEYMCISYEVLERGEHAYWVSETKIPREATVQEAQRCVREGYSDAFWDRVPYGGPSPKKVTSEDIQRNAGARRYQKAWLGFVLPMYRSWRRSRYKQKI
jgi:hypothetical protein